MIPFSQYFQTLSELAKTIEVTDQQGTPLSLDDGGLLVVNLLLELKASNNKAMVLGNGGSAAIAGHVHNDLAKAAGIRALAFQDVSLLTAMSNDHGYQAAYDHGIRQWAERDDFVLAISSSGESENMILATNSARERGCKIVTFSGFSPANRLRKAGDVNFFVPVSDYGLVENLHGVLAHYLTDMLHSAHKG